MGYISKKIMIFSIFFKKIMIFTIPADNLAAQKHQNFGQISDNFST